MRNYSFWICIHWVAPPAATCDGCCRGFSTSQCQQTLDGFRLISIFGGLTSKNPLLFLERPNAEGIPTLSDCCRVSLSGMASDLREMWRESATDQGLPFMPALISGGPQLQLFNVVLIESRVLHARRGCSGLKKGCSHFVKSHLSNFSPNISSAGGFRLLCVGFTMLHI